MKKQLQTIKAIAVFTLATLGLNSQTTADFQNLTLSPSTYWNGSTGTASVSTVGTFTSGNCVFPNSYNGSFGSFGGYWSSGWAYSNMKDSTTAGSGNQYSVRSAVGYSNSTVYSIAQGDAKLKFNASAVGKQMSGFYVNNSTYAYLSMKNGDSFAKKFGGVSGNDPDWFKLKIQKYFGGILSPNDSVTFYLADFRFAINAQDYIVKNWQYVNLTSLGNVDSLKFTLTSSDNSGGYMNTPSYFCMDNFQTLNLVSGITENKIVENSVNIYPNPTTNQLNISSSFSIDKIEIYNQLGSLVFQSNSTVNDISTLETGIYLLKIMSKDGAIEAKRFIKN